MAMVLDAFASYVADMVKQVAEDQVGMMLGVFGEIDKMGDKLQDLQNFLADADRRNITDERVREWVGQLKCAMYEATDILDLCHLKAMERGSSSFDAGCFNPLLFCRRNPSHAHEIGTRIKALNKRLDSIKERSAAFSFINLVSYEDRHSSKVHASSHGNPGHETSGDLDRSSVVGEKIEEDTRALVAQILQTRNEVNNNIMVIAIVGVGGIGKTTLAQKVFNDEAIQGNFSKKIWLSVNQNLSDVELLRRAITEVGGDHLLAGDAKVALNRTLKDALIGHKTLLVMDDVWDHGAWEGVLKIPLFNAAASYSRVIITTRDEGVARRMRATWPYHHVDTLTPDDAWSLLKKQVLTSEIDEDHIDTLKDIGLKIIQKCSGLPLAIKCFLYYSILPKSRKFTLDQVVGMWMRFIHGNSSDLEELGRDYYMELVSRNLIEPDKRYVDIWEQQAMRTLISTIQIKMKPGDSLATFCSLRTLHLESADVAALVNSLHKLKHLRYLALVDISISVLPESIGKMKLLQFLDLRGCENLENLPSCIVKLGQLRLLRLPSISMIPRGFRCLTNMRRLVGFQAHMDGDWCSLDELGPLSHLKVLILCNLENVSASSFAANVRLGEKIHLIKLCMQCTSRLGHDGLVKDKEGVSEEEQQRNEKVFDELYPPSSVEYLDIQGYFGKQLPSWMMSTSMGPLNNLETLLFFDLACCTQLPNGLCQLPYLQLLQVNRAPCIKRVGTGFLQDAAVPFPRLNKMILIGMVECEEWEWEKQVKAMPRLEKLVLGNCKLKRVPPGLACNARALKCLVLQGVQLVSYLENFPFVVELEVIRIPGLERITNLPSLQKLTIINCSKLKVLDRIPVLERLVLEDYAMEKLPEYMQDIKSRHLQLDCRVWLLAQLAAGQSGTEWDKFSHVEHVNAYAHHRSNRRKWYMVYTKRDNFKLDSNISSSAVFQETLSSSMVDAEGFESVYKMRKSTFNYVCSLVRIPFLEYMMGRLNSSKLKLSDGSDVGEYVIGDAGYPLLPWLLTPYQLEKDLSLSDSKVEFNSRHHGAIVIAQKALARLKDTWKCLQGEGWHPNNQLEMFWTVKTCCLLHNIVIYMEEEHGAGMPSDQEQYTSGQVRQIADEDAVRVRDALSRHMMESGAHTMAAEDAQEVVPVASGSGDENKEQKERRRQGADRGMEKAHDS
ncbi:hypothetical protein ACQ4PT_049209 [Festuca glaucescens]